MIDLSKAARKQLPLYFHHTHILVRTHVEDTYIQVRHPVVSTVHQHFFHHYGRTNRNKTVTCKQRARHNKAVESLFTLPRIVEIKRLKLENIITVES